MAELEPEQMSRAATDLGKSKLLKKLQAGDSPLDGVLRLDGGGCGKQSCFWLELKADLRTTADPLIRQGNGQHGCVMHERPNVCIGTCSLSALRPGDIAAIAVMQVPGNKGTTSRGQLQKQMLALLYWDSSSSHRLRFSSSA